MAIVFSVFQFTDPDCPFDIFKLPTKQTNNTYCIMKCFAYFAYSADISCIRKYIKILHE